MKRLRILMLTSMIFPLSAAAVFAQYSSAPLSAASEPSASAKVRIASGTVKKIRPEYVIISREQKKNLRITTSFKITPQTVIEGTLEPGALVRIEYSSKVSFFTRNGKSIAVRRNTALRISVL